MGSIRV